MASLGSLLVKIGADPSGLERGVKKAQTTVGGFRGAVKRANRDVSDLFGGVGIGRILAGGAIAIGFKKAFEAADRFDASQRQLAATAKITGQNLGFLQVTSEQVRASMGLSSVAANNLTIEVAKLTAKAGDIHATSDAMRAFLDLGAARGMGVDQTLQSVRQAILGIDEGTDKLFNKNPSVIYQEFAAKVGISAGAMTDAQKAQALLTAAMEDGGKVAGEYARFLESPAGKAEQLRIQVEQTAASIGQSMNGVRSAVLPIIASIAEGLRKFIGGIQIMGAEVALWGAALKVEFARLADAVDDFFGKQGKDRTTPAVEAFGRMFDAVEEIKAEIVRTMDLAADITGDTNPLARMMEEARLSAEEAEKAIKAANKAAGEAFDRRFSFLETHGKGPHAKLAGGQSFNVRGRAVEAIRSRQIVTTPGFVPPPPDRGDVPSQMSVTLGNFFGGLKDQITGVVKNFGGLAAAAIVLKPVFDGLRETLAPALSALAEPLRMVGQLLGTLVVPALKLLVPPLRMLVTAVSYVIEGFGLVVRGIGRLLDKIPGVNAEPIRRAGQEMIDGARAARRGMDDAAEAGERLAGTLNNIAAVFPVNFWRHKIGSGSVTNPSNPSNPGDPGNPGNPGDPGSRGPALRNVTVVNNFYGVTDTDQIAERVARSVERVTARGGEHRFQVALA